MANFAGLTRDRDIDDFRGNRPFPAGLIGAGGQRRAGHLPTTFPRREPGGDARSPLQECGCGHFDPAGCGPDHICPMGSCPELKMAGEGRYLDVKIFYF